MAVKINGFIDGTQPENLMKLLQSLASDLGDVFDINKLKVVHASGATNNVIYLITWPKNTMDNDERTVLVRIYGGGSDMLYDREAEIRTFESISAQKRGPRLLAQFPEGRVEEFIHGKTLLGADLRVPEISTLIAAKMREFHNINMPGSKNALIWTRLRKWLTEAKSLCSQEHAKEFRLDILENEINTLEKKLSKYHQEVAFCHNDTQHANIMMDENTRTVTFIDYEYSSYNPVAYDIANHFCEWAGDYHTDTPHDLDYSLYPDLEARRRFVRSYLSSTGKQQSDDEVDQFIDIIEKYTLANDLFWGIWGLIRGYLTRIDFNYIEYGRQRFNHYWVRKPQVLKDKMVISQNDSREVHERGI